MTKKRGNSEGSVYRRSNGTWRAQSSIDGGRLSYSAKTKKEAQDWLRKTANQVENGLTLKGAKTAIGDFFEDWLVSAKPRLTLHTWQTYCQIVRVYIKPSLGRKQLREINPSQIQSFYNQKVEEGVGLRTVQRIHTVIHGALNSAFKFGFIGYNPAKGARPPKLPQKELQFLNEDQVRKLLEVAKETDDRNVALYYIALVTGMRQGELLALQWKNLDLEKGFMHVKFNLKRVPGSGLKLVSPKTKSSLRTIKLGRDSVNVLNEQKERSAKEKGNSNRLWEETGYVFPSTIGTAMDPTNLLRKFRQLLKKAGLPKIRFHDLRHTAASLMLNNGVDVLIASQRLGHARPSFTLDIYGHLLPSTQSKAADVLDKLVSRGL